MLTAPLTFLAFLALAAGAQAAYMPFVKRDPLPIKRWATTCVVPSSGGGNDSPGWQSAVAKCSSDANIVFSGGTDYYLETPINATGLNNVVISIEGNLHLPQNITYVQGLVNATSGGNLPWISIQGSNVWLEGTRNVSSGWIYGYGENWWNTNPVNGTGLPGRPHLLKFNVTNGGLSNMKYRKPIAWVNALYGDSITVQNTFIDATTSPSGGFPFNTDGFDVTATNVLIQDSVILNGDDGVTVENGAENVTVENALIGGPGCHGMSVGSLGQNQATFNRVSNILFTDVTAVNSVYGARFKSWLGGQGLATNITWQNFHVDNVTFPIFVTQTYINQGSAQTQNSGEGANSTAGIVNGRVNNATVVMEDFTYSNWKGTINTYNPGDHSCVTDPCWYAIPGADGTQSVVIQCTNSTSCSNYQLQNIEIVPQSDAVPTVLCTYLEEGANPNLGFVCTNGTFVPTAAGVSM